VSILDLSQYDLPVDPLCMVQSGVTGVILGTFHPTGPQPMLSAGIYLKNEGIDILGVYGLPYFGSPYGENRDIDWAIANAKKLGVKRVWIDCEIDAAPFGFTDDVGATPERRVAVIRSLVAKIEAAGLEAGIYSAPWWWIPETNNCTEFSHLPLWFANYPADGFTKYEMLPQPFGGWTRPSAHQYTSTLPVCGRGRDANYVLEEDTMTSPEDKEVLDALVAIFGGRDKVLDAKARGMDYLLGYAIEQADQNALEAAVAALQSATNISAEKAAAAMEAAAEAFKTVLVSP